MKFTEYIKGLNIDGLVLNALAKYIKDLPIYVTLGEKRITIRITNIEALDK